MNTGKYELVVVWSDGSVDIYEYDSRDRAEDVGCGMEIGLGNQIRWYCVRPKYERN